MYPFGRVFSSKLFQVRFVNKLVLIDNKQTEINVILDVCMFDLELGRATRKGKLSKCTVLPGPT